MFIQQGWYISHCTSSEIPKTRQDEETIYIPQNVVLKNGIYQYDEYRFNLPIDYDLPTEAAELLAKEYKILTQEHTNIIEQNIDVTYELMLKEMGL